MTDCLLGTEAIGVDRERPSAYAGRATLSPREAEMRPMITLYIRYTIDMTKLREFEVYLKALATGPVERCGGIPAGYYLPTKIAGPMNAAIGMTDFPSLAAYASFREKMAADLDGLEIRRRVEASGAILNEERSFLSCVPESRR